MMVARSRKIPFVKTDSGEYWIPKEFDSADNPAALALQDVIDWLGGFDEPLPGEQEDDARPYGLTPLERYMHTLPLERERIFERARD